MLIHQFEVFLEVCLAESITGAAERLNMTQPAVSTIIRDLERYYNVRLFDRMNRRIYITPAGEKLRDEATSFLSQLDELKSSINDPAVTGKLRIGSNIGFAVSYLSDVVAEFAKKYPNIPMYNRVANTRHLEDQLMHNDLDFAIADRLTTHGPYIYRHLHTEDVHLLCSSEFAAKHFPDKVVDCNNTIPITLEQLAKLPLILRELGSGARDAIDTAFRQSNLTPNIIMESSSTPILTDFCTRHFGVALLTSTQAMRNKHAHGLTELTLTDTNLTRHYYVIYHKSKYLTKAMLVFFKHLEDWFPGMEEI